MQDIKTAYLNQKLRPKTLGGKMDKESIIEIMDGQTVPITTASHTYAGHIFSHIFTLKRETW